MNKWEAELAAWAKKHPMIDYKDDRDTDMGRAIKEVEQLDIGIGTTHRQ